MMNAAPWSAASPARLRPGRAGYSLIEIMVAMTLLTVIVVGLLASFNQTQRALRASVAQTDTLENGRAFLNLLGREMQEIVLFPEGVSNAMRFASVARSTDTLVQKIPGSSASRTNRLQSFCFTVRNRDNADWRTVFYDFRKSEYTDRPIVSLYRAERDFAYRNATNDLASTGRSFLSWTYGAQSNTNDFRRMLDGVIHLQFYAYDQNGVMIPEWSGVGGRGYFFTNQIVVSTTQVPAAIEVELGLLDPDVLRRVKAISESGNPTAVQDFLSDRSGNVQIFRQRINLPSGP
jgi:prepilin-type N-terminal cleavage/methylation domain-containing protein